MTVPNNETETDSRPTMKEMEDKFVGKEVCSLTKASVDTAVVDIGEMKETMASMAKWMEIHHETHAGGWKKAQTIAVIVSTVIASVSLVCSTVAVVFAILKYI